MRYEIKELIPSSMFVPFKLVLSIDTEEDFKFVHDQLLIGTNGNMKQNKSMEGLIEVFYSRGMRR